MLKEIAIKKDFTTDKNIETIYFGGGTPSLLTVCEIESFINELSKYFDLSHVKEFTIEANPDDINLNYLKLLKTTPINRFSLGVQSFLQADLQWMNRAHNANQATNSIKLIQDAGFDNISIDLIYGTPNLTNNDWENNLNIFFKTGVTHLSSYCLTVEPNTALHKLIKKQKYEQVDDEKAAQQFDILMKMCLTNGFEHYEISNFAKNQMYALHNTNYWKGKHYIGIGPSAHSYNGNIRCWNIANNHQYINAINNNLSFFEEEKLSIQNKYNEYVMTQLRTQWGINENYIEQEFGKDVLIKFQKIISKFINNGLVIKNENIVLTNKGKYFADAIASELFII